MKYRRLGNSGIEVSSLCLGAMMFGGLTEAETSGRIVADARERGVNFIDTADVYNGGASEEVVGRAIVAHRDDWVIATKFGAAPPGIPNVGGGSRRYAVQAFERSLKRLGTDYIDILYLHVEDPRTPVIETVTALGDLIRAGKLRYYALSNHSAWKLAEFSLMADALGIPRPVATQTCYNIANRQPEIEQFVAADHLGLGVVVYSPLARGVLTAKYRPGEAPPADTRAGRNDMRLQQTEWRSETLDLAQQIARHSAKVALTSGQFSLAWVLANPLVSSVIAGPRTEQQWQDYLPALDYRISDDDEALVDALVPRGHPSTHGFTDPAQPIRGRPTSMG